MSDFIGGMRRRAAAMAGIDRRRRLHPAAISAPFIALAGVAVAGLLLWDERRRTAMRQRLEATAGSVGSSISASVNRSKHEPAATGVGQD